MTLAFEIPLLVLLIMTAAGAILVKDLISAVFILGCYSFLLALMWAWLGAVDVAFVEAVVGSGLATVFFLVMLFGTAAARYDYPATDSASDRRAWATGSWAVVVLCGDGFPKFGDAISAQRPRFCGLLDTGLSTDRHTKRCDIGPYGLPAMDTLIETAVIFTAGIACTLLLRRSGE